MGQTLEELAKARGNEPAYKVGPIMRRLNCTFDKTEWHAFDIMRGRGHSVEEIIRLGLSRLRYEYAQVDQREDLSNEVGPDPVKGYVYMRPSPRGKIPHEFTLTHGAYRKNVLRVVILNIIELKDHTDPDERVYQVLYMLDRTNGVKVDTEAVFQSKKKGKKIDRWLLNHFELVD